MAAIEPDDDLASLDGDSAFGESISDMTDNTSIDSSIRKYRQENGRTYHSYGVSEYYKPNDEEEQDHLDIAHQWWTLLLDGNLISAPLKLKNIHRVLDLGTGTGIWAIDFADLHPEADVKGIDISPIQPSFVPPNCRFEVDDFNVEFYDENKFDLIHQRELTGCIKDPPLFYQRCFDALAPGGWMDISELEVSDYYSASHGDEHFSKLVSKDHPLHGNVATFVQACEMAGLEPNLAPKIESLLQESGFQNIKVKQVKSPVGTWAKDKRNKEIGAWNLLRVQTGIVGYFMRLGTAHLGWTPDEVQVYCAKIRAAYKELHWQLYFKMYFISAQKPFDVAPPATQSS